MQRVNCTVRLNGDTGNTVLKSEVTVAEVAVLRSIHGNEAVVDIKPVRQCKTPHREERDRLSLIYGAPRVAALFPGMIPRLPVTLDDIALVVEGDLPESAQPVTEAPTAETVPEPEVAEAEDGGDGMGTEEAELEKLEKEIAELEDA